MKISDVIRRPLITEKTTVARESAPMARRVRGNSWLISCTTKIFVPAKSSTLDRIS